MNSTQKEAKVLNKNKKIFTYLAPYDNEMLSNMKGLDLVKLLSDINDYYLELRSCLGFEEYITFGLELEFENAMLTSIIEKLNLHKLLSSWSLVDDASLNSSNSGEVNSPIFKDKHSTWQEINSICQILKKYSNIGPYCASQTNIGTQILGGNPEYLINFLELWANYENIIYRFLNGEFLTTRRNMIYYASPMALYIKRLLSSDISLESLKSDLAKWKFQAVSFKRVTSFNKLKKDSTGQHGAAEVIGRT